MKNKLLLILISVLSLMLFFACSDVKENIPVVESNGVHPEGIANPNSPNFHGKIFQSNNWDLKPCQQCHAADFSGGTAESSCITCHNQASGPLACNTCHGDFSNPDRIAPPSDLVGNTSTTAKGVGAHDVHVYSNSIAQVVGCFECHQRNSSPGVPFAVAHINGLPAEMEFGEFSNASGNAGYSYEELTCANTYCHGNFEFKKSETTNQFAYTDSVMVGNNYSPKWNKVDGTQAACGTCHGQYDTSNNLLSVAPVGHTPFPLNSCVNCHPGVVDASGNIIDKLKHINGSRNVFGN